ncbi:MAG: hypothetical protein WDA59_08905 [Methanofastidiosum sp.]
MNKEEFVFRMMKDIRASKGEKEKARQNELAAFYHQKKFRKYSGKKMPRHKVVITV